MTDQIAYFLIVTTIGLALAAPYARWLGVLALGGLAAPLGLCVVALAQLALLIVNIKLTVLTLWLLIGVLALAAVGWAVRQSVREVRSVAVAAVIAGALVAIVAWVQNTFSFAVLSYDSYDYVTLAANVSRADASLSSSALAGFLSNYAPLLWLTHSPARLMGLDFLTLLHPLLFGALLLTTSGLVEMTTRGLGLNIFVRAIAIVVPAIVLSVTPQVLHHAVYVMPNLVTGLLLTGALACVWTAEVHKQPGLLVLAAVLLSGVALARLEGGLICALVFALLATAENLSVWVKSVSAAFVASIGTLWYVVVIVATGAFGEGAILTPVGAMMQIGVLWVGALACVASGFGPLRPLIGFAALSLPAVLILAHFVLVAAEPATSLESMGVFLYNATWPHALWGPWWGAALAMAGLAMARPSPIAFSRMLAISAISLVLLTDLLGFVRGSPYRLGDQDSGNRMLLHVFPLVWAFLAARLAAQTAPQSMQKSASSPAVALAE